jgi:hypothetical protein
MKITEFQSKEKTFKSEEFGELSVTRRRTSEGSASITIEFGPQRITFEAEQNANYEEIARVLADLLLEACDDACLIAKEKA